jgi:ribosomal protein L39E
MSAALKTAKGVEVSKRIERLAWANQQVAGSVRVASGHFFIVCARVQIFRGPDLVASWNDAIAEPVEVSGHPGESLLLELGGQASIYSDLPVSSTDALKANTDAPPWFKDGFIGLERFTNIPDTRVPVWMWIETNDGLVFGPIFT